MPQAPMLWLLISVQWSELLWVLFNALGWETTATERAVRSVSDVHLVYMPWSHSIASAILSAGLGWILVTRTGHKRAIAAAVAAGVLSHILLDLVTHAPDIVLAPGIVEPRLGLGLYGAFPLAAFVVEILYGVLCWRIYHGSRPLLACIVLFNVANLSMLSPAVPGLEQHLAGRPQLIVAVIAAQIAVTLFLVGFLSREKPPSGTRSPATP